MMPENRASERMRKYLWTVLEDGDLSQLPQVRETILLALHSQDESHINDVAAWVRLHNIQPRQQAEEKERLFVEPKPGRLRGQIYMGRTMPGGHPVFLPLRSFGGRGHVGIYGTSGTGKSTQLNFMSLQLMEYCPVMIYDVLDQSAEVLIPHVPMEKLGVLDFKDYRRNFFLGPPGIPQIEWLQSAEDHLIEAFGMEPITMEMLIQICEDIIKDGQVANLPRILDRLDHPGNRSQSHRALKNRLIRLKRCEPFQCERGSDVRKLFKRSFILNLKGVSEQLKRLVYFDHYHYLSQWRKTLPSWRLRNVSVFHESSFLSRIAVGRGHIGEPFVLRMIREARNFGVGFCCGDQAPHLEHTAVKSNIGTRCLFRLEDDAAVDMFTTEMGLTRDHRNVIMNLPDRRMLLRRPDVPKPFLVEVPRLY